MLPLAPTSVGSPRASAPTATVVFAAARADLAGRRSLCSLAVAGDRSRPLPSYEQVEHRLVVESAERVDQAAVEARVRSTPVNRSESAGHFGSASQPVHARALAARARVARAARVSVVAPQGALARVVALPRSPAQAALVLWLPSRRLVAARAQLAGALPPSASIRVLARPRVVLLHPYLAKVSILQVARASQYARLWSHRHTRSTYAIQQSVSPSRHEWRFAMLLDQSRSASKIHVRVLVHRESPSMDCLVAVEAKTTRSIVDR